MTEIASVQRVALSALHPAPWNPRLIRDKRFKELCKSLQSDPSFMERRPILATADGTIYAGNMRYRAAEALKWKDVPAILDDIPEQLAKERALRDNNPWGEYVDDQLAEILYELQQMDTDLLALGFEQDRIDELLASVGVGAEVAEDPGPQEVRANELREKWGTERGQIWQVGRHRLMCGDSTSAEDVGRLMGGEKAAVCFTSPPYAQQRRGAPRWQGAAGRGWNSQASFGGA